MNIEEIKKAYISKDENANRKAKAWIEIYIFGTNTNGESFWSIGISYVSELLNLLGDKEEYDKFSINGIIEIINNEKYLQELLETTSDSEYTKLKEILTLNEPVKKMLYDYIKNKITEYFDEEIKENLDELNVAYHELNENSFHTDINGKYIANNVLFSNLKINQIEIHGDINKGLTTLQSFIKEYKDEDLKKLCVESLMMDNFISDWDDNAKTFEGCYKLIDEKIYNIEINNEEIEIWFGTIDEAFGGHTPVLYLNIDSKEKSIELVG